MTIKVVLNIQNPHSCCPLLNDNVLILKHWRVIICAVLSSEYNFIAISSLDFLEFDV